MTGKILCIIAEKLSFGQKKNLSLYAGKLSLEKKVCAFELCLVLIQKYTKSFGGKNLAPIFSYQKSSIFFVLTQDAVQIRRNFFPLGNPPYAKKSKRDSQYFDLFPGPFKSATLFFIYIRNKRQ